MARDDAAPLRDVLASPRSVIARLCLLLALLATEFLVLSVRYDSASLQESPHWWSRFVVAAPLSVHLLVASFAAALLVSAGRVGAISRRFIVRARRHPSWPRYLGAQVCTFAAFAALTHHFFENPAIAPRGSVVLFVLWFCVGGLQLLFLGAAAAPWEAWRDLVRRERQALAAGALVGFAAWCVGRMTLTLWEPLSTLTFDAVVGVLRWGYPGVVGDAAEKTIATGCFAVRIDAACSGYEGIGLVWVFLGAFLWAFRRVLRFPQALLLLPIGAVVMWCVNVGRIVTLIAIGTSLSREAALGGFHSQAGWLAFNAVTLGMLAASLKIPFFSRIIPSADNRAAQSPAPAYVIPLLVLVATMMVTGAVSAGTDWIYPLRVATTGAALWHFRAVYARFDWSWTWRAVVTGAGVFVIWLLLERSLARGPTALSEGLAQMTPVGARAWLWMRILGSVVAVPVAEELALRGYLMRRFATADFDRVDYRDVSWHAVVASSLIFGLMHNRWVAGTAAGLCYAWAVRARGNLVDGIVAHATTNALIAGLVVVGGYWSLWS